MHFPPVSHASLNSPVRTEHHGGTFGGGGGRIPHSLPLANNTLGCLWRVDGEVTDGGWRGIRGSLTATRAVPG